MRKMKHLVFFNEIHVWVKSIYQSEYEFLKKKGFLDQMKSFKVSYDSPTDAKAYAVKIAEERVKHSQSMNKFLEEAIEGLKK